MRADALFINGVFEGVLQEILLIQRELPEHIMFLQPFTSGVIRRLHDNPPKVDDPMRLYVSLTTDLPTVHYVAEIVGWDDKRELSGARRDVLNRILDALQPKEGGLFDASRVEDRPSVNLLHIRRLKQLATPFTVAELIKTNDGQPLSPGRTTSGGWAYVQPRADE